MADDVRSAADAAAEGDSERLLTAIEGLIRRGDELNAQRVAELERAVTGLEEVLRALATRAITLADIRPPMDPDDAAAVDAVVEQARKVMDYLEPPMH